MNDTELFFTTNPAEPWSMGPLGLPALGLFAAVLVVITVASYLGHPQANRHRVTIVLVLRLLALFVALLTAVRPSVGIQEDPKVPSTLLIGVDLSESMTVPDELGNRPRIEAVRKTLEKCEPILEELRTEQNVNVVMYAFGPPDFSDGTGRYDPSMPAAYPRSDYGTFLNRGYDRWQVERFVRGLLIIGDGQDNGTAFSAQAEADRWRKAGRPVSTFAVGSPSTSGDAKDVAITALHTVSGNPDGSVFIKTDFTLKAVINALGFKGATVPVRVQFDDGGGYKDVLVEQATLAEERDNSVELKLKAPDTPGEIKVRVEVPVDRVPGDVAPSNNVIETYLTVTKEGMRVLLVNRLGFEHAAIRRALQADQRIDLFQVITQPDSAPTPQQREDFDFNSRAYDVIVIGNVSAKQLQAIDPTIPARIAEQVKTRGVGLIFTGGHATFLGTPGLPDATGWRGVREIEEILPVDLNGAAPVADGIFDNPAARFAYLPTFEQQGHYLSRLADTTKPSMELWDRVNDPAARARFTGLSKMGPAKPTATVFAVSSDGSPRLAIPAPAAVGADRTMAPLLVGHQIGVGNRGRVLALAAQDTYLWQKLGQPKTRDGVQIHARFWRQMVRWLAHQEDDEGAAYARPDLRRLPIRGKQTIRVGLRGPGGAPARDPKFVVKVIAPGENEATTPERAALPDPDGAFKLTYDPALSGEYQVKVTATGRGPKDEEVQGEATARFLAYPEVSDEMVRKSADHEFLQRLATAGGGTFHRLEDLPSVLKEIKAQPVETVKPRPKYLPDWRRDHSKGFLPGWLVAFAALLGTEWALRRLWGMV